MSNTTNNEIEKKIVELTTETKYIKDSILEQKLEIKSIRSEITEFVEELRKNYSTKEYVKEQIESLEGKFSDTKKIVYGAVGIILTSVIYLILKNAGL